MNKLLSRWCTDVVSQSWIDAQIELALLDQISIRATAFQCINTLRRRQRGKKSIRTLGDGSWITVRRHMEDAAAMFGRIPSQDDIQRAALRMWEAERTGADERLEIGRV